MKLLQTALQRVRHSHRHRHLLSVKYLSTDSRTPSGGNYNDNRSTNSSESSEDFEQRMFHGASDNGLFKNLDKIEQSRSIFGNRPDMFGGDGTSSTLTDGMEGKLKNAASYFEFDQEEMVQEDYNYRPDMNFRVGDTYTPEDLNLRKPGVWKPTRQDEFEVTTEEVLKKADFRNVRFLANFLTEAGILMKRSQTGISAKAQRKVAREIKTARALGLLPFTTMGTKQFVFGKTMEDRDEDFEVDRFYGDADHVQEEPAA